MGTAQNKKAPNEFKARQNKKKPRLENWYLKTDTEGELRLFFLKIWGLSIFLQEDWITNTSIPKVCKSTSFFGSFQFSLANNISGNCSQNLKISIKWSRCIDNREFWRGKKNAPSSLTLVIQKENTMHKHAPYVSTKHCMEHTYSQRQSFNRGSPRQIIHATQNLPKRNQIHYKQFQHQRKNQQETKPPAVGRKKKQTDTIGIFIPPTPIGSSPYPDLYEWEKSEQAGDINKAGINHHKLRHRIIYTSAG